MASERYKTFGRERLLALAETLETVKLPGEFNMAWWISRTECGTSACAIGWGIELGVLPGLEWNEDYPLYLQRDRFASEALSDYFGIKEKHAHALFLSSYAQTPKEEANLIREFVAKRDAHE